MFSLVSLSHSFRCLSAPAVSKLMRTEIVFGALLHRIHFQFEGLKVVDLHKLNSNEWADAKVQVASTMPSMVLSVSPNFRASPKQVSSSHHYVSSKSSQVHAMLLSHNVLCLHSLCLC